MEIVCGARVLKGLIYGVLKHGTYVCTYIVVVVAALK
jgi:hypothetical protein